MLFVQSFVMIANGDDMNMQIDSQKLLPLITAFYGLTGMKIAIYDNHFNEVLTCPEDSCPYCKEIWQCRGREVCDQYTASMCKKCQESKKPILYTCHAGLTEVVSPLTENETVIGYAVCGQVTSQPDRKKLLEQCGGSGIPVEKRELLLRDVKYMSHAQIEATLQIINALVSYIILQKMIYASEKPVGLQIAEYIAQNVTADLSVSSLCRKFAMSRSRLYLVTQEYMPYGIAKYIKKCRMDAAAAAIEAHPEKPLWVIAQESGFEHYEYFLRVFRKEIGKSPK